MTVLHQKSIRMVEQELINIWKNASKSAQINIETNQLIHEFDLKLTDIQKKIRKRDLREISASIIGIIIFSYLAYEIPFPVTKISCFLSISWFVFVIYKFKKSKKQNTAEKLSISLKEQLENKKELLQQQVKLLNSAAYWYAGFSFITNIIFIIGLEDPTDHKWSNLLANNVLPLSNNVKLTTIFGLSLFYLFVAYINRRAANKELQPIINNIENIQNQLNTST